jgi:hypothetical protein
MLDRAEVLLESGRFKEASYLCRRVLVDEPGNVRAVLGLARCAEGLGDSERALSLYRRARGLAPGHDGARAAIDRLVPPPAPKPTRPRPTIPPPREEPAPEVEAVAPAGAPDSGEERSPVGSSPDTSVVEEVGGGAEPPLHDGDARSGADVEEAAPVVPAISPPSSVVDGAPKGPDADDRTAPSGRSTGIIVGVGASLLVIAGWVAAMVAFRRRQAACTLRGQLEKSSLPELLQWLSMSRKDGELRIRSGIGRGRLGMREGQPISAVWGRVEGTAAVFEMLSLDRGSYVFRESSSPASSGQNFGLSLQQILMQWAYETDEASRNHRGDRLPALESMDEDDLNANLPF